MSDAPPAAHYVDMTRTAEAVAVYSSAADELGGEYAGLRRRLEAGILQVAVATPALQGLASELISHVRNGPDHADLGGMMLGSVVAFRDTLAVVSAETTVAHARRLTDVSLFDQTQGSETFARICLVLMAADRDDVTELFDIGLTLAHQRGSQLAHAGLKCFRALAWLWRGYLVEAEANAADAVRAIKTARLDQARLYAAAYLSDALMEQGRTDEAASALHWANMPEPVPASGHWYWLLESRARLLLLQGRTDEGLEMMLTCGRRYAAHGGQNPALIAWRSGAALALLALGRRKEARTIAADELELARRWGAPRALGHALRVLGLVQGGEEGLTLLRQAVTALAPSPAHLEHAKALFDLGLQ